MQQMSFIHWCQVSGSKSSSWCHIIPSTSWSTSLSSSSNWFFNSSTTYKIRAIQVYVRVKSPVRPGHWFGYVAALQKTKRSKLWIVPLGEEEIGWSCEYPQPFECLSVPGQWAKWLQRLDYFCSLIASEKFTNSFDQLWFTFLCARNSPNKKTYGIDFLQSPQIWKVRR